MRRRTRPLPERLWSKVDVGHPLGCWQWTGAADRGYGRIHLDVGGTGYAHRVAYELLVGAIPEGMQLDHLCRNRSCVNPDHLEPVTNQQNQLRSFGPPARNARKTRCPRGHALRGSNLYVHPATGNRQCQTCRDAHRATSRAKVGAS